MTPSHTPGDRGAPNSVAKGRVFDPAQSGKAQLPVISFRRMRKLRFIFASILVVLLALSTDPMGHVVASASVTGHQATPAVIAAAGGGCGVVCGASDHAATAPSSCVTGVCWNVLDSSATNLLRSLHGVSFSLGIYGVRAGISGGPDPRPPSSLLSI